MFDILFKNGILIDGTGAPAIRADAAVSGGRIAAVERDIPADRAHLTYDISGRYIAPGFIDLHTHSDFPLLLDRRAASAVYQGVTTQVIGNCGFAPAPLKKAEDIRRNVFGFLGPYIPQWSEFHEFLDFFSRLDMGTNVAALVGHGALRSWQLGYDNRISESRELENIERQLRTAMEAGAFGLSTGLEYAPGINAGPDEMKALCSAVASFGGLYATHVRNRDEDYRQGFSEAFRLAGETGVRLQISHAVPKYGAPADAASWFLKELRGVSEKTDAAADVIPYEWGPTALAAILPKELLEHDAAEIADMLDSRGVREQIVHQKKPFWLHFRDGLWDQVLLYHSEKYPDLIGRSAYEIGEYFHSDPFNGLLSVLQGEGESMFSVLMMGKIKSRVNLELLIQDPLVGVISDAMSLAKDGPLAGQIWSPGCYGWVPHYFREFIGDGKLLTLEKGIEKITGFPAQRLGLNDRGVIRKGARADITVFGIDEITETATMEHPKEYARGFSHVMCNGQFTIENGLFTGNMPGKLLRRV